MAKVQMPQLGESVAEGTIGRWLKQPGDHVDKYEPLVEVITDKVNAEVPSPFEGTLTAILVEEGATVPNNAEIAVIRTSDDEAAGEAPAEVAGKAPAEVAVSGQKGAAVSALPSTGEIPSVVPPVPVMSPSQSALPPVRPTGALAEGPPGDADARMTPAVRRLLREHGLSAAAVIGTGGGGRITREDVQAVVEAMRTGALKPPTDPTEAAARSAPATAPAPTPAASSPAAPAPAAPVTAEPARDDELVPLTQLRKGIAAQMTRALAVPHAYLTLECDMTSVVRLREVEKQAYQDREGISLSYVAFVVKATVEALRKHPNLNAHWTDQGLLRKRRVNIGIAVALDDGLIVPVVHDADTLSISGLNRAINDLAARARANHLRLDDLQGGTFTVDNTGWFGSVATQPVINVPQVAILTMESIVRRAVVRQTPDGEAIVIRSIMNICCALDHRATDGAQAGRFTQDVIRNLEAMGPDTPIY